MAAKLLMVLNTTFVQRVGWGQLSDVWLLLISHHPVLVIYSQLPVLNTMGQGGHTSPYGGQEGGFCNVWYNRPDWTISPHYVPSLLSFSPLIFLVKCDFCQCWWSRTWLQLYSPSSRAGSPLDWPSTAAAKTTASSPPPRGGGGEGGRLVTRQQLSRYRVTSWTAAEQQKQPKITGLVAGRVGAAGLGLTVVTGRGLAGKALYRGPACGDTCDQ